MFVVLLMGLTQAHADSDCGTDSLEAVLPSHGTSVPVGSHVVLAFGGMECSRGTGQSFKLWRDGELIADDSVSSTGVWFEYGPLDAGFYSMDSQTRSDGKHVFTVEGAAGEPPVRVLSRNVTLSATFERDGTLSAMSNVEGLEHGMRWVVRMEDGSVVHRGVSVDGKPTPLKPTHVPLSGATDVDVCFDVHARDLQGREGPVSKACVEPASQAACSAWPTGSRWWAAAIAVVSLIVRRRRKP